MIPVDLNRLREAMTHGMQERDRRDVLAGLGAAVLDVEPMWWCASRERAGERRQVEDHVWCGTCDRSEDGCGFVALVPVKGGQE